MESFNSFELNKVLGAVLGTCLIVLAINIGAGALYAPPIPAKPGFAIAAATPEHGAPAAKEPEVPLPVLLAKAEPEKGKSIAKQCQACHTFEKGGPNRVGPNLYNIVGSDRGEGRNGFNFSQAMKTKGGKWTFDELNKFLTDPRGYIPGTAMTFAGLKRDTQRADVIAFLDTLSDNPVPLPKPEAAAPAAAAPAAGGAPAAQPAAPAAAPNKPAAAAPPAPAAAPAAPAAPAAAPAAPAAAPAAPAAAPAAQPAAPPAATAPAPAPAAGSASPPSSQPAQTPAPK
jgi:cytochrome c